MIVIVGRSRWRCDFRVVRVSDDGLWWRGHVPRRRFIEYEVALPSLGPWARTTVLVGVPA